MILIDEAAFRPLLYLGQTVDKKVVVICDGQRYGGFTSREHANWCMRHMGKSNYQFVDVNYDAGT